MLFLLFLLPMSVKAQLIDNRDLPPVELQTRAPFIPTDRANTRNQSDTQFFILDNADDIEIQNFPDDDVIEVTMLGNIRVRFDGNNIRTEKLILSIKNSVVINVGAYGNTEFTLNGTKYLVDSFNYQPDMERGVMFNVRSVLGLGAAADDRPWFYRAERVTILESDRFVLDNVSLTTTDVRFDHFQLKVAKMWYIQDKVALTLGMQYMAGQTSFFWLPVFFQLESTGKLHTSFGNERRIGYYLINNYKAETKIGTWDIGFDFYERQGQYFQLKYAAPAVGVLQELRAEANIANDVRLTRNGDLFSQWVLPQTSMSPDYQRITQFAWRYRIDTRLASNGISLKLKFEDLNDPFFLSKYSYRTRFDSAKAIDFIALYNPQANSWYSYAGDTNPVVNNIVQEVALTMGNLSLTASWDMIRTNPTTGNQFENDFYDYQLRTLTLPNLTYNFGSLNIAKYTYTNNSRVTVVDSTGRKSEMFVHQFEDFALRQEKRSNRIISNKITVQNGLPITNKITNWEPITLTNVTTNSYQWFDLNVTANATATYQAIQTFGTNTTATTTDLDALTNTNRVLIADQYQHTESGSIAFNMSGLDSLISLGNNISMRYHEQWSSFASQDLNDSRTSGLDVNYNLNFGFKPNKIWFDDEVIRTKVDFSSTVSFTRPLYRFRRNEEGLSPLEQSFQFNNSFTLEYLQWRRQTLLGLSLGLDYAQRKRIVTDATQIDQNTDVIIDDITFDQVTAKGNFQLWWIKLGTELALNVQLTDTNNNLTQNFTNRLVGGYPRLVLEFTPNSTYHYIPSLVYRYNLLEQGRDDTSFNLEFNWDLRFKNYQIPSLYPFIYELSEFGLILRYHQDFVNLRNSSLRLDFTIGIKFTKYLTFKFTSQTVNSKIYLYYPNGMYNGQSFLTPGEQSKNFFDDLWDGLQIWNIDALRRSEFKLQNLNFELIHDLDTWDMRMLFSLGRRVDNLRQVAYWEPFIGISFTMKGSNAINFFPNYDRRFVPLEFQ